MPDTPPTTAEIAEALRVCDAATPYETEQADGRLWFDDRDFAIAAHDLFPRALRALLAAREAEGKLKELLSAISTLSLMPMELRTPSEKVIVQLAAEYDAANWRPPMASDAAAVRADERYHGPMMGLSVKIEPLAETITAEYRPLVEAAQRFILDLPEHDAEALGIGPEWRGIDAALRLVVGGK